MMISQCGNYLSNFTLIIFDKISVKTTFTLAIHTTTYAYEVKWLSIELTKKVMQLFSNLTLTVEK